MNLNGGADINQATDRQSLSGEEDDQRFRSRVAIGTLVGVMTCLLFASLLMLINWLPNLQGDSLAGGTGGGVGAGTGAAIVDGTSSSHDASGDNDRTVTGEIDAPVDASAGRDGPDSGTDAKVEDSGNAELLIAQDDVTAAKGAGTVDAKKSPPQLSFTVPPLERIRSIHRMMMVPATRRRLTRDDG